VGDLGTISDGIGIQGFTPFPLSLDFSLPLLFPLHYFQKLPRRIFLHSDNWIITLHFGQTVPVQIVLVETIRLPTSKKNSNLSIFPTSSPSFLFFHSFVETNTQARTAGQIQ
jgi:hypothetical protein